MGRMYAITFREVAVTAVQDFFEVVPAADSVVIVHGLTVGQSSDAGDSADEQLSLFIHRGVATGSGGSSATPVPMSLGDAAFGGTAEVNNTTQSADGVILHADAFNVRAGYQLFWTPETRPVISPSDVFIVALQTTPADSLTMSGTLLVEELGG